MKLLHWVRYSWDLGSQPQTRHEAVKHYKITPAGREDENELRKVLSTAFLLDPAWNPMLGEAMQTLQTWLDRAFASDRHTFLALRHGTRIIGASVIHLDPEADNHLAPGPCLLMEYRNRGFGTRLLESSLNLMRSSGLKQAFGVARELSPVAKFLYPKFDGVIVPAQTFPLAA